MPPHRAFALPAFLAGFSLGILGLVTACIPEYGTNGTTTAESSPASGACFEVDLTDGLDDGDEVLLLFDCFNAWGAFDPLSELVTWLATSESVDDFLSVTNGTLEEFDVVGALEATIELLDAPEDPVGHATDLYVEVYEDGYIPRFLALGWEASDEMLACEESDDPDACSLPRLSLRLVEAGALEDALSLWEVFSEQTDEDLQERRREALLDLLYQTSTVSGAQENPLLELGAFLVAPRDETGLTPLEELLPYVQYLIDEDLDGDGSEDPNPRDDDFVAALAPHLARLWRDGVLEDLPDQLEDLYTTDSDGEYVGFEGCSIMDELMEISSEFGTDTSLLYEEFSLPGSEETTTVLELTLDTLDSLYLNEADIDEMVAEMESMVEELCEGSASTELCDLTAQVLPPMSAAVETGVAENLLPVVYVAHQLLDFELLLEMSELALELELLERTEFLTEWSLEYELLDDTLALFPVFVDEELGLLTADAERALGLVRLLISPLDDGLGSEVTPALVPLPLFRRMLDPIWPQADLDYLLGRMARRLEDPDSAFHVERLEATAAAIEGATGEVQVDWEAEITAFLEDEDLWMAGLRLGAELELMDLLTPAEDRQGAPWYLYDIIQRGLFERILTYVENVLDMLVDEGWIPGDTGDTGSG